MFVGATPNRIPMKQLKQAFYRFAYRLASRLSDITGGARLFVRWKVALAAIIIGFSATALSCRPPWVSCYETAEPTCYAPVAPEQPAPDPDEGEKARYDASDPHFMEEASPEFTEESPAEAQ